MFTKRIHVFRAGDQTSAQGVQRNFSSKDLQQVVETYDPSIHEAPLVVGHQGDSDSLPSFGWIKGFSRQGDNLYADVEFTDTAKDLVKDGHYRKVSISFYSPDSAINPNPGKWSARHLALLGAAPPAVKGLEPFSFSEEGVFEFATAIIPSDIFDDELGPSMMIEKSPLEMLKEKLETVRSDMGDAVKELQQNQENQKQSESSTPETDAKPAAETDSPSDGSQDEENPTQHFTEITQQTADLEDQFPEDEFMDHTNKISRKHANGAHGQVMQVVENVYDEQHKELPPALKKRAAEVKAQGHFAEDDEEMDTEHGEMPAAFKKNMEKMKAKAKDGSKEDKGNPFADEHSEVSYKKTVDGKVTFGTHPEGEPMEEDRMDDSRSDSDSYGARMKVGKQGADGNVGRMKTAASGAQDADRMNTAENGEQEADRKKTSKVAPSEADASVGPSRWEGQSEAEERVNNMDQYDVDAKSYGVNAPKTASGSNPAGREDSDTKFPTETEETPDNTVFAVDTENVMDDKDMRVLRQKSSDGRKAVKGGAIDHAEEETQGSAKFKKGQLEPGQFEGGPAEIVGPGGAFAEVPKGEPKSNKKQLVPGAMDEADEADQTVGPDGAYAEDNLSGDFEGGPNQKTKRSGGVFAEEHKEKPNPYTKTGFGSTYDTESADDDEDDYNELSTEHCGMNYGMESGGQVKPMGMESMYQELAALKKENERMKREYQEAKMSARKEKLSSFVENLYEAGKITDGIMPQSELQSYCEGLEFGTLEFSEGETAATKLLGLLNRLPNMVEYGEVVAGGTFQYAEEDLDPHTRALKLVESEGLDYVEALKRSMYS